MMKAKRQHIGLTGGHQGNPARTPTLSYGQGGQTQHRGIQAAFRRCEYVEGN